VGEENAVANAEFRTRPREFQSMLNSPFPFHSTGAFSIRDIRFRSRMERTGDSVLPDMTQNMPLLQILLTDRVIRERRLGAHQHDV
jgi:hypothetical protein